MMAKLTAASLKEIESTPELLDFARALGKRAFADNCAPCHGAGGGGAKGYPNLNDNDWLWGGSLDQIAQTITHGVRAGDDAGHQGIDAGLRSRRPTQAGRNLDRRRLRALALGTADRRKAPISRAAPRSSPTIARPATGRTAKAIARSARRT